MSWLEIFRRAKELLSAVREKFPQRQCPNPNCPLGMNKPSAAPVLTQDQMIQRQRELYKKNHPKGK